MTIISIYNQAKTPLGLNLPMLVDALQFYVDKYVSPAWHVSATLKWTQGPVAGTWGFVFLDDADQPDALAYHTVEGGLPLAKVFVRTVLDNGETLSGSASHELAEMLVDPGCETTVPRSSGTEYAYEIADPVEETTFMVDGFPMSDFVYPAYFDESTPFGTQLDQCKVLSNPFQLAKGGYQSICKNGDWTEIFGSLEKQLAFSREDRRGHRNERRRQKAIDGRSAAMPAR